uniref:7TM_GPCR_Srx domain-containing protein n=1 Tax=Elaeophora elaphi TaxID=1147741 RepID=A0A0R3RUY2_9BILA
MEAVALCVTWILLIRGKTIWQMRIMQIAFGIASACELGYESYMFLIVDRKYYKLFSSYTRAATLIGRFFAYALAQFLVSFHLESYLLSNQITSIQKINTFQLNLDSSALRRENTKESRNEEMKRQETEKNKDFSNRLSSIKSKRREFIQFEYSIAAYGRFILQEIKIFAQNTNVLKWSIWWTLTSCGFYQITNYVQSL